MNKSDSERIAGYLERLGYVWTDKREKAGVVVTTTCGVRQSAEDRVYGIVPKIKKENPKAVAVVTGCLAGRTDVQKRLKESVDIWLPINDLDGLGRRLQNIVPRHPTSVIEVGCRGIRKSDSSPASRRTRNDKEGSIGGYLSINPKYESNISAFVPIGNGCNNFCAYCVVPYARGREAYRPAEEVLAEVKSLVKKGYKEIILIAQNVNSYKSEVRNSKSETNPKSKIPASPELQRGEQNQKLTPINFARLLKQVNSISGNFWIRFATSHPKNMSEELIETIAGCEKVCHQIHLPAQAGDNEVLKRMNRKYTREHYLGFLKKIRAAMPDASISTDVIVGFPGETKQQFKNTEKLFRQAKFDMAFIAQYSPRPGTAAARFKDDVMKREKKRREEALTKILRQTALTNNKKYLGKTVEVMIDGRKNEVRFGKTKTGKNVKVKTGVNGKMRIGDIVKVKIDAVKEFNLSGTAARSLK